MNRGRVFISITVRRRVCKALPTPHASPMNRVYCSNLTKLDVQLRY